LEIRDEELRTYTRKLTSCL